MTVSDINSSKRIGRTVGALLLLQMAGFIAPFAMLHPIASRNWLAEGAPAVTQIHIAIGWLICNTLLTGVISALLWPAIRERSIGFAVVLACSAGLMVLLQSLDGWQILSMLGLSRRSAGGESSAMLSHLAAEAVSARRLVHYPELVSIDLWMATFYAASLRLKLLPPWLALFALVTVGLHFGVLVLPMILGGSGIQFLGATMALSHVITAGVLLVKGLGVE